jgi:phosphopantothenoylcysteine decarboxylase/phosphopantothenate--cysteine ligase
MNVRMWEHAATQRNIATLRQDGVKVMNPDVGDMACGEFGPGRLPEPEAIADEIEKQLNYTTDGPLNGRSVVVTAGPTREALDPVRYISNHSSGKQGYAIAYALSRLGADVTLVSGPTALPPPKGVTFVQIESAVDMLEAVKSELPADVFVSVAAVADWRPAEPSDTKIKAKTTAEGMNAITLVENPDILKTISHKKKKRPELVIGFAAETNDVVQHAQSKLDRKGCDWIVANDVSGDVMGGAENEIILIKRDGQEKWPRLSKGEVALRIAERVAEHFSQG